MRPTNTSKSKKAKTKNKKKQKQRKNGNVLKKLFEETNFNSDDESDHFLLAPPNKFKPSTPVHTETKFSITPSRSECDLIQVEEPVEGIEEPPLIPVPDFDEIESDDGSVEASSTYNRSVVDEFLDDSSDRAIKSATVNSPSTTNINTIHKLTTQGSETSSFDDFQLPDKNLKKLSKLATPTKTKPVYTTKAHYCPTSDGMVVIIDPDDTVHFHGFLQIIVLHGEVEILGQTLSPNSSGSSSNLYSIRGTSLLYIKNVTQLSVDIEHFLGSLNVKHSVHLGSNNSAIILCKKLEDKSISFVEKHVSQQILPIWSSSDKSELPRAQFEPHGDWNVIRINPQWNDLIAGIKDDTRLLVCGGKSVGKSTFIRYAINRLLLDHSEVQLIDLDPGQPEFTVPGCISIVRVTTPTFGPNFTHLTRAEKSLLCNINIAHDPMNYIRLIGHLLKSETENVPTLINYMGFIHGIGVNILSSAITLIRPSDVVEIRSGNPRKNFRHVIDLDMVEENSGLFYQDQSGPPLQCEVVQIKSMCDHNDGWSAEPRQMREMCVLSYLSRVIPNSSNSIFDSDSLFRINLSDIVISDLKGNEINPAAVNANLVSLCRLDNQSKQTTFICFGWGIVRGIDMDSNCLVVITPENLDTLEQVTHLVIGNGVSLPPSVYMTPDDTTGEVPYVSEGTLTSFGQITKRSRVPAKK